MQGKRGEEWLSEFHRFSVDRLGQGGGRKGGFFACGCCPGVLTADDLLPGPQPRAEFWGPKREGKKMGGGHGASAWKKGVGSGIHLDPASFC